MLIAHPERAHLRRSVLPAGQDAAQRGNRRQSTRQEEIRERTDAQQHMRGTRGGKHWTEERSHHYTWQASFTPPDATTGVRGFAYTE